MGNSYIGEIRMFAGNFAPQGWALCNGQSLSISENDTLFTLIGTTYGGDGQTTFNLPNLQSRLPVHVGSDGSGNTYTLGVGFGTETASLTDAQLGAHTHSYRGSSATATALGPGNALPATGAVDFYTPDSANLLQMAPNAIGPNSSDGNTHYNIMPCLCVNFILSLQGIYPSRS